MTIAGMRIESGVTVGGGISIGPDFPVTSGFTITSADISNPQLWYAGYSSFSSAGFTSTGTLLYNGIRYDITSGLYTTISAAQTAFALDPADAWAWYAAFATGGNVLVRLGLVSSSPNFVVIAPIDQSDTQWQSGNINGPTLTGTFAFPATFTPFVPHIAISNNTSWC
jgi:hypothetical protein